MNTSNRILFFFTIALSSLITLSTAATFTVRNQCSYTIWAAALPGGGQQLNQGQSWTFNVANGTRTGRIWARTKCNFDAPGGTTTRPRCETGDCGAVLRCQTDGATPKTLVEYALNQFNNMDLYDISLIDGFNVPVELSPVTTTATCRSVRCAADITAECPAQLRVPGGCNHPCNVFKSDEYCCNSGSVCVPTNYSRFFKSRCPEAYSFPTPDGPTSTLVCAGGTNYRVVFCP